MVAEPAATPVTTPVVLFTVAMAVFELLQLPPVVASVRVVVLPTQTLVVPPIAATVGNAFTVTEVVDVFVQPLAFAAVV